MAKPKHLISLHSISHPKMSPDTDATEMEIDAVLAEFGGDPRAAVGALLHDLTLIIEDAQASVSRGYVRGRLLVYRRPGAPDEEIQH
jgi:hypothetical protein